MQVQIQALITRGVVERAERIGEGSKTKSNIEMAKLLMFNGNTSKVGGFIIVYKLYLGIKMREATVEEQI